MAISISQWLIISTLVLLVPLYLYFRSSPRSKNPSVLPTNWPIVHMFPSFIANRHNVHDYLTMVLAGSSHNFRAHGPPGIGMRFFITCDPANVRHIFTTNYTNFPKGAEFAAMFDIMGGSLFTIDGEPCRRQHLMVQSILSSLPFVARVAASCHEKLENSLLPFFVNMARTSTPFDVQEVMSRFMFDLATRSLFGVDPGLLASDMPPMDVVVAMDTVMEVGYFRHGMPVFYWKAMRWLNIGFERKLRAAHTVLRGFVTEMMGRRKIKRGVVGNDEEQESLDVMSSFINDPDYANDELLQAIFVGYMVAARDTVATTVPWILYNLAQNPAIMSNIRSELSSIASRKVAAGTEALLIFEPAETKNMVYLRAVLYETLRLYPPSPFECKTVAVDDTMPSGHEVHAGDTIVISLYSMGRMKGVWGKNCLDYNPGRWLSEDDNKLRYVPSHKFLAFSSGPRMCLGKDIGIMQMKTIIATIVWNFDVYMVEGQSIKPKQSSILKMKNGLMVKLKKREMKH